MNLKGNTGETPLTDKRKSGKEELLNGNVQQAGTMEKMLPYEQSR